MRTYKLKGTGLPRHGAERKPETPKPVQRPAKPSTEAWRSLRCERVHGEPGRFRVASQTRAGIEHLVDLEDTSCTCEWSMDFKLEGQEKTWCAHIKRSRLFVEETAMDVHGGIEARKAMRAWFAVFVPLEKLKAFLDWLQRNDPGLYRHHRTVLRPDSKTIVCP